jgi:7-cyano-7-deazaguanine synthase in queuosine biosynthesis
VLHYRRWTEQTEGTDVKTILLHSGGMDSHVCWLMNPDWKPVYVDHDSGNRGAELAALAKLAMFDKRFKPTILGSQRLTAQPDGHIPFRNAMLLTAAVTAFPESDAVAFGALLGEGSGDKSRAFAKALERTYTVSENRRVRVLRPLRHLTKAQALRRGLALTGGHNLCYTTSCYHGTSCGRCQACFRLGIARYLVKLDQEPPALPTETLGVWATIRSNQVRRIPTLAASNFDVVRAYSRHRVNRVLGRVNA